MQIDPAVIIDSHIKQKTSPLIRKILHSIIPKILRIRTINSFLAKNEDKNEIEFIDGLFDYLDFSYSVLNRDFEKIPSEGRLIIVANHPLGALDGLALIKMVSNIRKDVTIVANNVISSIEPIKKLIIPFALDIKIPQKQTIEKISSVLQNEGVVIFFPSGEVSRLKLFKISDGKWQKGPIHFAQKYSAPILPIHIKARNSLFFYFASMVNKYFSMLLLPSEIFAQKKRTIHFTIGHHIPSKNLGNMDHSYLAKLLKKHVYRLNSSKKSIFKTENNIIHPIDKKLLHQEIRNSEILYTSDDGKKVIVTDYDHSPNLVDEIARLREITFRVVGEGTGNKKDKDKYDKYYKHIVLWDSNELEIIGAYRVGIAGDIIRNYGLTAFYTSTLFSYNEFFYNFLPQSIELGRSFIQKKYWNSFALEHLWRGLGRFIAQKPEIKYLFGVVSMSNSYPEQAKKMIVHFYKKWYGDHKGVYSKFPYILSEKDMLELDTIFSSDDYKKDYSILKQSLKNFNVSIPTLYKNYVDLVDSKGVHFLDFGVDEEFNNCVDSFIFLELEHMTQEKRNRYFDK